MDIKLDQVEELIVLMVEDKISFHEVYKTTICTEFPNVELHIAENGASAKKMVSSGLENLHLIILDYGLPDISGEDLLDFFRSQEKYLNTPIMFLTGEGDPELQSRLLDKGANDFVEKGASPDVLLARMAIQLRQKLLVDELTEKALSMELFTAGVLHDIRNIETNVIARCDLIERRISKETGLENRESILEDLAQLKAQTYRINDYANAILKKVRLAQKTIEASTIDLETILEWVRHILGVDGDFHLHQDTPLAKVHADGAMLKLIFLNICQNSLKYSRDGEDCHVYVSEIPQSTPGNIEFAIEDNGPGVPENELQAIFLPFHRASNNAKRDGMGLGLSMAARVVQKMKGKLWAENGNRGLCIHLQLPAETEG